LITGKGSLLNRNLKSFIESLTNVGLTIKSNNNFVPLEITGHISAGDIFLDGSSSSQTVTGFLMALPIFKQNSVLHVNNLKSKPYIDLTLDVLKKFGIEIYNENYQLFKIQGNQTYKSISISCENDWSSASFMIVAGALAGRIEIQNLNFLSKQADISILKVLEQSGCKFTIDKNSLIVENSNLKSFEFDAIDCPDLIPILTILASQCEGVSKICGIDRLFFKESNRAKVIFEEFSKIGINIKLLENCFYIKKSKITGGIIKSHNDHRIAMSAVIISLVCENTIEIDDLQCINKSYPDFLNDFFNIIKK
jgi:3-phosphoshikimate 1-carboxyvinyltransferase